jgi:hypothetical protein
MAYYAKVYNGVVTQVIVAREEFIQTYQDPDPGEWVQTSFDMHGGVNSAGGALLRKNYAGIGYSYDADLDAFIPPKPYDSWTLDESTCLWASPTPRPQDDPFCIWDESVGNWVSRAPNESGE